MQFLKVIDSFLIARPTTSAVLIGSGLGLAFIQPIFLPVAYLALVGLFYLITILPAREWPKLLGIIFTIKAALALAWFWNTFPITWLPGLSLATEWLAVLGYWLTAALWLGSAGIFLAGFLFCGRFLPRWLEIPLIAAAVVLAEYCGAVFFSLLTIGPGAYIGGAFSFGHSGYLFPWLYPLAKGGGVYLVGFGGLVLFGLVANYFRSAKRYWLVLASGLVLVVVGFGTSLPKTVSVPKIALVQTDFTRLGVATTDKEKIKALDELLATANTLQPDYIILPEDSRYLNEKYQADLVGPAEAIAAWQIIQATNTATIIDSGRTSDGPTGQTVQRAYVWNQTPNFYTADKQYLVPQGEYMPILYTELLRMLGLGETVNALESNINYRPGPAELDDQAPATIPNIMFCFESVDPLAAKRLQKNRPAEFIVHPMSHAWFHEPVVLWRQLETMLRFQSVYAGVPIVSVGNQVRGQLYLPNGRIVKPVTQFESAAGTVEIVGD